MKVGKRKPSKIRRLTFDYLGDDIEIEYNVIKSYKAFTRVREDLESDDVDIQKIAMVQALVGSLTDWDIEDENGEAIPISAESFDLLPGSFVNVLFDALREDVHEMAEHFDRRRNQ